MSQLFFKGLTLMFFITLVSCFVKYKSHEVTSDNLNITLPDSRLNEQHKEKLVRAYLQQESLSIDNSRVFSNYVQDSVFMYSSKSGQIIESKHLGTMDIDLAYKNIVNKFSNIKLRKIVYLDADEKEIRGYFGSTKFMTKGQLELEKRKKYAAIKSFDTLTQSWKYEITDTLLSR